MKTVDLDTTIAAMALTAKEKNSKYKESSEGGLAVSVALRDAKIRVRKSIIVW